VAAAEVGGDQVERRVAGQRGLHPELVGAQLGAQPVRDDAAAAGGGRVDLLRAAHGGDEAESAGGGQAQPGAAGLQVTAGEDLGAAFGRRPPAHARGRAIEELVAVGGDHQGKTAVLVDRDGYKAHGAKSSTWRVPRSRRACGTEAVSSMSRNARTTVSASAPA